MSGNADADRPFGYCPSIRKQPPITKQIPAITISTLLQPHPAHGPRGPDG